MKLLSRYLFINFSLLILLESQAQISFKKHIVDNSTLGAGGIYVCDIDDDGDNDILAAGLQDNKILLFLNEGGYPITWNKQTIGANVGNAHSVFSSDFDNDNDLDIIGAAYVGSPGIALWTNNGGNILNWTKSVVANSFVNAHEIYADDIDNDGLVDILGASSDLNKIAWWKNNGGNPINWIEQEIDGNIALAKSVHAGDINGDGLTDVIGASILNNDILLWKNDGSNPINWTKEIVDANFIGAHRVQAVDLDNDNDLDILAAAYIGQQIAWWENNGIDPINWTKHVIKSNFTNACIAYAVDIDSDGDNDIIGSAQGANKVSLWLNDNRSKIGWTEVTVDNNFYRVWPLHAGDIDGDGDIDIVGASSHNGNNEIRWWENMLITSTDNGFESIPSELKLFPNYPNPFNPVTKIKYSIPSKLNSFRDTESSGVVSLKVFDLLGREIKTLVNQFQLPGEYEVYFDASDLASGIYIYTLRNGDKFKTRLMMFLK